MQKTVAKAVLLSFLSGHLAGCSTVIGSVDTYEKFDETRKQAETVASSVTNQRKNSLINNKRGIYVDTTPIKISEQKTKLLETFPSNFVLSNKSLMSIQEISDRITKTTGLQVVYSDLSSATGGMAQGATANGQAGQTDPSQAMGNAAPTPVSRNTDKADEILNDLLQSSGSSGLSVEQLYSPKNFKTRGFPSGAMMDANFDGKLTDFLDYVAGRSDLFWKFDQGERRIIFYKYDAKVFNLYLMSGDMSVDVNFNNNSNGGGSSSSGSSGTSGSSLQSSTGQTVKLETSIKAWKETTESIEKMLSRGGKLRGNEALGKLVVIDTPMVLAEVGRYVDEINLAMSRQVTFDVAIYDVNLSDNNTFGIDWNFVWNEAAKYATGFKAASQAASTVNSASAIFTANWANSAQGSSAIVKGLETQGRVALKSRHQAVTINNIPVPVKVADETTYLASTSGGALPQATTTASPYLTTQLQPGKVVTGLTMTILPRIFDASQLMLQLALDLSTLKEIKTITSGTASIQAPTIGAKSFIQRVSMKNNETLIMSGFDQDKYSVSKDSSLDVLSGIGRIENHIVTVIMVTPHITEGITGF